MYEKETEEATDQVYMTILCIQATSLQFPVYMQGLQFPAWSPSQQLAVFLSAYSL